VNEVVIVGPPELFAQLPSVPGVRVDHPSYGEDAAGQHVLLAEATDDAIPAIEALGLTVEVQATLEEQNALIAQIIEEEGTDVTDIDIA
jgi:hypothetical protein